VIECTTSCVVMPALFPRQEVLQTTFLRPVSIDGESAGTGISKRTTYQARPELYGAFSVVDDAKGKAQKLSAEATKEFEKASAAAQAKTGKIELYSGRYYAACTFGGLLACVSKPPPSSSSWSQCLLDD